MIEFGYKTLIGITRKGLNNTYTYVVNYGTKVFRKICRNITKSLLQQCRDSPPLMVQITTRDQQIQIKISVDERHLIVFILVVGIYWVYHNRRRRED